MKSEQLLCVLEMAYQAEVEVRGGRYKPTSETKSVLARVAAALTSERPKQGMMLCGTLGNGKSTMTRAIQSTLMLLGDKRMIPEAGMRIVTATELAREARSEQPTAATTDADLLAIDDVGREAQEVNVFGNVIHPLADLLEHRYDRLLFTLISTNLTPSEMRERYGDRVADRLREMMEVIAFSGESFRGKNN